MGVVTSLHSCFSKIQIGFSFLVLAHPGSPGQRAIKRVCVRVLREIAVQKKSDSMHGHPLPYKWAKVHPPKMTFRIFSGILKHQSRPPYRECQ